MTDSDDTAMAATLASGERSSGDNLELTEPGRRIGRFVVLELLGQGAMGIVVAAYDADLDRKVALKLLRPGAEEALGTERLLREARAMAKLAHPNVLAVHEVGTVGDQVFLAMEFAAGGTLRAWCKEEPRSWREVLDRFLQAARGLDAAHQVGLVHRDFKPENVLLTAGGDVRVADFGLVGIHARPAAPGDDERPAENTPLDITLTRTGMLVGTPAYMAPEQFSRANVGPAADQFALCASLWEALYGVRPFPGRTYWELAAAVIGGNLNEPPTDRDVPPWLREVLRRGLRAKPAERWPSVAALVEALERDPVAARGRRLRRVAAAAGLATLGGLVVFGLTRGASAPDTRCKAMDAKLAGIWDADRAVAVRTAFLGTERPFAADTFDRVNARLDDYTGNWVSARIETCEATHVRGEQSEALLDLRMACLDQRLTEIDALVDVFAKAPNEAVLAKAIEATTKLPQLETCADKDALQALVPPPVDPTTGRKVEELRARLAEAKALEDTGQFREALPIAKALVTEAEPLDYAPLLADALYRRARLEERTGAAKEAEPTLELAMVAAAAAHDDVLAVRIWSQLMLVVGSRLGRAEDAMSMRTGAEAALYRAGSPPDAAAGLWNNLGNTFLAQGKFADAVQFYQRAISTYEKALGPDHPVLGNPLNNLALAGTEMGTYDDAEEHVRRALVIFEKVYGPDHPDVATAHGSLASLVKRMGRYDEARVHDERALAIRLEALGADHPDVALSLNNLGNGAMAQARYDEAEDYLVRSLAIFEKVHGPEHRKVAQTLAALGGVYLMQGQLDEASERIERALAIREKVLGSEHPETASSLVNLGELVLAQGKHLDAQRYYTRAAAIFEKVFGAEHPDVAYALNGLASASLSDRPADAVTAAERAVRIREARRTPPEQLANSRFVLARALWKVGRERPRARSLARQARDAYAEAGKPAAGALAEVEAWIAKHSK